MNQQSEQEPKMRTQIRIPVPIYQALLKKSAEARRSFNSEMIFRLQESLQKEAA